MRDFHDDLYPTWHSGQTLDAWVLTVRRDAASFVQDAVWSLDKADAYIAQAIDMADAQRKRDRAALAVIEPSFIERFLQELAA